MSEPIYSPLNEPIIVFVSYNKGISEIISKNSDTFSLATGANAEDFLITFFETYPEVFELAVPGTINQKINGAPANPLSVLLTGDSISLELISENELLKNLSEELKSFTDNFKTDFTGDDIIEDVFVSKNDNVEEFISKYEYLLDKSSIAYDQDYFAALVFRVFNSFPQKRLGGISIMKKMHNTMLADFKAVKQSNKTKRTPNTKNKK